MRTVHMDKQTAPLFKVAHNGVIFFMSYPTDQAMTWINVPLEDILEHFRGKDLHEHVAYHFKTNSIHY